MVADDALRAIRYNNRGGSCGEEGGQDSKLLGRSLIVHNALAICFNNFEGLWHQNLIMTGYVRGSQE